MHSVYQTFYRSNHPLVSTISFLTLHIPRHLMATLWFVDILWYLVRPSYHCSTSYCRLPNFEIAIKADTHHEYVLARIRESSHVPQMFTGTLPNNSVKNAKTKNENRRRSISLHCTKNRCCSAVCGHANCSPFRHGWTHILSSLFHPEEENEIRTPRMWPFSGYCDYERILW